jgi:hypothetical protein
MSHVVLTRVHMLIKMRAQPSRRQRVRHTGKHVTCTGHVSKAKRGVHEQTQNKLNTKYPARNFNESRAMKGGQGASDNNVTQIFTCHYYCLPLATLDG